MLETGTDSDRGIAGLWSSTRRRQFMWGCRSRHATKSVMEFTPSPLRPDCAAAAFRSVISAKAPLNCSARGTFVGMCEPEAYPPTLVVGTVFDLAKDVPQTRETILAAILPERDNADVASI